MTSVVASRRRDVEKGPAARPAGFHQVALLSLATATNAPPMPSARLPTASTLERPPAAKPPSTSAHTHAHRHDVAISQSVASDPSRTASAGRGFLRMRGSRDPDVREAPQPACLNNAGTLNLRRETPLCRRHRAAIILNSQNPRTGATRLPSEESECLGRFPFALPRCDSIPAAASLPARVTGVLRAPRATFAALARTPRWAAVMGLTLVVTFLSNAALLETEVGRLALIDQWERTAVAFGQPVDDAPLRRLRAGKRERRRSMPRSARSPAVLCSSFGVSLLLFALFDARRSRRRRVPSGARRRRARRRHPGAASGRCRAARTTRAKRSRARRRWASCSRRSTRRHRWRGSSASSTCSSSGGWWCWPSACPCSTRRPARHLALGFIGAYVALAAVLALVDGDLGRNRVRRRKWWIIGVAGRSSWRRRPPAPRWYGGQELPADQRRGAARRATSRRSCRRRARSSRSGRSTSPRTRWAASPVWPSRKASASRPVSSCSRSTRDRSRASCSAGKPASPRRGRRCSRRAPPSSRRAPVELAQQNLKRQQELWKDGLTTREALERAENEVAVRQADLAAREQEIQTREQQIRQEQASLSTTRYNLTR